MKTKMYNKIVGDDTLGVYSKIRKGRRVLFSEMIQELRTSLFNFKKEPEKTKFWNEKFGYLTGYPRGNYTFFAFRDVAAILDLTDHDFEKLASDQKGIHFEYGQMIQVISQVAVIKFYNKKILQMHGNNFDREKVHNYQFFSTWFEKIIIPKCLDIMARKLFHQQIVGSHTLGCLMNQISEKKVFSTTMFFSSEEYGDFRMKVIEKKVFFIGSDIIRILGFTNASRTIQKYCNSKNYRLERVDGYRKLEMYIIDSMAVLDLIKVSRKSDQYLSKFQNYVAYMLDLASKDPDVIKSNKILDDKLEIIEAMDVILTKLEKQKES